MKPVLGQRSGRCCIGLWGDVMTDIRKDKIRRMRADGSSYSTIAAFIGISENTVKSFCQRNGLGSTVSKPIEITEDNNLCKNCGKHVVQVPKQKPKKFCSQECRLIWWNANRDKISKKAFYEFKCKYCSVPFKSYGNRQRRYRATQPYAVFSRTPVSRHTAATFSPPSIIRLQNSTLYSGL